MSRPTSSRFGFVAFVCASALSLTACGGGGGGGDGGAGGLSAASAPPPSNGTVTLNSRTNVRSQLSGTALRADAFTDEVVTLQGTFDHATTAITLNDGQFAFADPSGVDANGVHEDGTAALLLLNRNVQPFDFVNVFVQQYTLGGQQFVSTGVVGIATPVNDVPSVGTATFNGDVFGAIQTNLTGATQTFNGDSTVDANFGSGLTNLTFNNLRDDTTNLGLTVVDTITVNNMRITGNTFSGGTLAATNGGVPINLTGANTTTEAQGQFFGPAGSQPDEVGGSVLSRGADRVVAATFVAD